MIETILDTIAPHRCSSCGENGRILCESCKYDIESEPFSGCLVCLKPCGERGVCRQCLRDLPIEQAWCVGERRDAMKKLGDGYKFDCQRAGADPLAGLLDSHLTLLPAGMVVVGIPASPGAVRSRGFDHVGLIVKAFAKRRGLALASLLYRENDVTLHFLGREEREKLAGTLFSLKKTKMMPRAVLLVDDIITTGTTVKAATKLLKSAGVEQVFLAVLARQPFDE